MVQVSEGRLEQVLTQHSLGFLSWNQKELTAKSAEMCQT